MSFQDQVTLLVIAPVQHRPEPEGIVVVRLLLVSHDKRQMDTVLVRNAHRVSVL